MAFNERILLAFAARHVIRSILPARNSWRPQASLHLQAQNQLGELDKHEAKNVGKLLASSSSSSVPPLVKGEWGSLSERVRNYVLECAQLCRPDNVFICDGSEEENSLLLGKMQKEGMIKRLPKYQNCWLTRTDPADVARVERLTFISTRDKRDTVAQPKAGVKGLLGNWMSPDEMENALSTRFPGCMQGRTMYVIPYSMGPLGSPLAKIGIELTDSPYVVASMRVMTRMGKHVLETLGKGEFVKCLHSVGLPLPNLRPIINGWPCDPEKVIIAHLPERNEICSYGSGYGGNSLLGKKCLALRLGSIIARKEGWLAEHMLILGITNPQGKKVYVTAAFPSACGKTNLAMLIPTLPGYKVECVGDDIAWLKFDEEGTLRAINPEAGIFGVAPGTSSASNPNAMATIDRNTLFTNVGETADGGFWWEGLEEDIPIDGQQLTDWTGQPWSQGCGRPAAHPNSRFCAPLKQCPVVDPLWEDPKGVPISAIIFGGRRPQGVPLVYESLDWSHGVFVGSAMRSEATAAAEHSGKVIMHDPFAMRPFFGYNFGHYLQHWLDLAKRPNAKLPRIFHVNWFRKDAAGRFLWPGFGENCRVLEWILRRVHGEDCAVTSPIGFLPAAGSINLDGLGPVDMNELMRLPKDFWLDEVEAINRFYDEQIPEDLPQELRKQLQGLADRVAAM